MRRPALNPTRCRKCDSLLVPNQNWATSKAAANNQICKGCEAKYRKEYAKRPKYKEMRKIYDHRYNTSPRGRTRKILYDALPIRKAARKRYQQTPRAKALNLERQRRYRSSDKGKAKDARYERSVKGKMKNAKYRQSPKGRQFRAIVRTRRRKFPPCQTIIGKPFLGSHLHHLTPDVAIYIPDWLHRSIPHNLKTGYNMDKINVAAMEWYEAPHSRKV